MYFSEGEFVYFSQTLLKFDPEGSIDNMWALVQVMAWHWIGDKPLPEPMLTEMADIICLP